MSGCKCTIPVDQYNGWECDVSGSACLFIPSNSKLYAEIYDEWPDINLDNLDTRCIYKSHEGYCELHGDGID